MEETMQKHTYKRKNYWALDVAKVICAIFLVSAHFASEGAKFPTLIDYLFSVYIIAVNYLGLCIVLLLTMGFSVCMIALSKKIKILKWIM